MWPEVVGGALWVGGLALALSTWSVARWQTQAEGKNWRTRQNELPLQIPFALAGLLVSLGLGISSLSWWERILWFGLSVGFAAISATYLLRPDVRADSPDRDA